MKSLHQQAKTQRRIRNRSDLRTETGGHASVLTWHWMRVETPCKHSHLLQNFDIQNYTSVRSEHRHGRSTQNFSPEELRLNEASRILANKCRGTVVVSAKAPVLGSSHYRAPRLQTNRQRGIKERRG